MILTKFSIETHKNIIIIRNYPLEKNLYMCYNGLCGYKLKRGLR